jgi:hypothetical protein
MPNNPPIGLVAQFETKEFETGLKIYNSGLEKAKQLTQSAASAITSAFSGIGGAISNAFGMVGKIAAIGVGALGLGGGIGIATAIPTAIAVMQQYYASINQVNQVLHVGTQASAAYVGAMKIVGLGVSEGAQAFQTFADTVRQTNFDMQDISRSLGLAIRDNNRTVTLATRDQGESIAQLDLQVRRTLEDQVREWQRHAEDIALVQQREREDYLRSLSRFDRDSKESLRGVHGRERRLLLVHLKEQREDMQRAEARTLQDRQISEARIAEDRQRTLERERQDNARNYMLLTRSFQESMFMLKQGVADLFKQTAITQSRNPILEFLKKYNLDIKALANETVPLTDRMQMAWKALDRETDATQKARVMTALFGNNTVELTNFLRNMNAQVGATDKLFKSLGLTFDPKLVEEYNQGVARLGLVFDGVGLVLAQTVAPYMTTFNNMLADIAAKWLPPAIKLITDLLDAFNNIDPKKGRGGFLGMLDVLQKFADDHKAEIEGAIQNVGNVIVEAIGKLKGFGDAFNNLLRDAITQMNTSVKDGPDERQKSVFQTIGENIIAALGTALQTAINTVGLVAGLMSALFKAIWDWWNVPANQEPIIAFGKSIGVAIGSGLRQALVPILSDVWTSIQQLVWMAQHPFDVGVAVGQAMVGDAQPVGKGAGATVDVKRRQSGGYIPANEIAMLHAGEYVLNRQQVQMLVPILAGASGGNTYNFNHSWSGSASAFDKNSIERVVQEATFAAMRQVIPGA